jgi:AcrR family transcriptional regulator
LTHLRIEIVTEALAHLPEQDSAKRTQILDGARKCFLAHGFDGASMNDIVAAAGVSKGTVYSYFTSKETLFAAMVFQDKRHQAERRFTLGDETRPISEVLYDFGMKLSELAEDATSIPYARLVIAAAERFPEIGRSFYEAGPQFVIDKLAVYFETQMAGGALRRNDSKLAASQFVDLIHSGILKPRLFGAASAAQRLGVATVVQSSVDLFLNGMRG